MAAKIALSILWPGASSLTAREEVWVGILESQRLRNECWNGTKHCQADRSIYRSDDRFIARVPRELELDALTKFAPSYFEYMKQSIQHKVGRQAEGAVIVRGLTIIVFLYWPTALAKIYGCFKIRIQQKYHHRKSVRMNVVIMEEPLL